MILGPLINNVALLITLSLAYGMAARRWPRQGVRVQVLNGLLFGGMCIAVMSTPLHFSAELQFDVRSIVHCLAGLFAGTLGAGLCAAIAVGYRIHLGGVGALPGAAVSIGVTALALGYLYWMKRRDGKLQLSGVFGLAVAAHIYMILCMFLLPWPMSLDVIERIAFPVMLLYPLGTMLCVKLILDRRNHMEAAAALRNSEEEYRKLATNLPIGLYRSSTKNGHTFQYVNPAMVRMFGYDSQEELLDTPIENLYVNPPDRKRLIETLEQSEYARGYLLRTQKRDGTEFEVRITAKAIRDDGGSTTHYEGLIEDVTEAEQAKRLLVENERKYKRLIESTHVIAWELDLATKAFTYMAPQVEELFGYPADSWRDLAFWEALIHPDDREHAVEVCSLETALGRDHEFEYRAVTKDGKEVWIQEVVSVVSGPDGPERLTGFMRDITEQKKTEESLIQLELQLRQAQKMEAVGQLAGGVAHDFNNLLQVIIGYTEIAIQEAPADTELPMLLGEVAKAGKRAESLVSQLLAFSRRQVMRPATLDLNEIITDTAKMLKRLIGEHIQLDIYPGSHLGRVYADRGMVEQVLVNLCVNARDAMETGGTLSVETENVYLDEAYCASHPWAKAGRFVLLSVTDTGHGIEPEVLEHVFEPFFTTKDVGQGTGLGLATVYGIVKQHEGMVQVYSEQGKGTTFKVYLPLCEREASQVGNKIRGESEGGSETILLAEDDDMVRSLAQKILERAGYSVIAARNGEEAVALFEASTQPIDLLMLDVVMPRMGGREACERIRKLQPGIPVIFSSGYSANAVHTNFVLDEGLTLVQKPYQRDSLLKIIREVLGRE